jgi:hypothetical protein
MTANTLGIQNVSVGDNPIGYVTPPSGSVASPIPSSADLAEKTPSTGSTFDVKQENKVVWSIAGVMLLAVVAVVVGVVVWLLLRKRKV